MTKIIEFSRAPSSSLAYRSGGAGAPLLGHTVASYFASIVARQPEVEALVALHQDIRWTYAQLDVEVERAALALLALGIEPRDRIGIWSPNCAQWTVLQLATARVGAILVNINPAYRPGELAYALQHSGVRVLFCARSFKSSDYLAMIAQVRAELPALERVITIDGERADGAADLSWDEFAQLGQAIAPARLHAREAGLGADDPINIQYTSGTTGNPKGATLSHHNILNNAIAIADTLGYDSTDRVCIPLPLYHCFGMGIGNLGCIAAGATMVYPSASFEALATLQAIERERCTSVYGVPTMFIAQLEHPRFAEFDLSSLRTGLMGGAPCPVEVMKRVMSEMHASEVCIIYGMTETAPVTFMTRPADSVERRVGTVGTVMPNIEVKIVDPDTGLTLSDGMPGEVCTRGYAVMHGYWNDPRATAAAIDEAGWMHTGDVGTLDQHGYLNIVGRIKDMLIRGGENVYPREIEEVLFQHPAVASVQVVGVPDARMGEEIMAWIIVREGMQIEASDVRDFCRQRLAHFKVPRYVKLTDAFPLTVTGKVQKYRLRELAIEELGLQVAAAIVTA